mmetsp:Transcript_5306/g.7772  ORF Transcript_5306/g.7772 Transcript_5306/m.7772 type:complete len:216 (+) Transcript_5306:357-1004(+)
MIFIIIVTFITKQTDGLIIVWSLQLIAASSHVEIECGSTNAKDEARCKERIGCHVIDVILVDAVLRLVISTRLTLCNGTIVNQVTELYASNRPLRHGHGNAITLTCGRVVTVELPALIDIVRIFSILITRVINAQIARLKHIEHFVEVRQTVINDIFLPHFRIGGIVEDKVLIIFRFERCKVVVGKIAVIGDQTIFIGVQRHANITTRQRHDSAV